MWEIPRTPSTRNTRKEQEDLILDRVETDVIDVEDVQLKDLRLETTESSQPPISTTNVSDLQTSYLDILLNGIEVQKYGRFGKPHLRRLWVTDDKRKLCWKVPKVVNKFFVKVFQGSKKAGKRTKFGSWRSP